MKTPSPHDDVSKDIKIPSLSEENRVICPHCDAPLNVIHDRNIQVAPYMAHTICVRTKKKTEIHCLQNELKFLENVPYSRVMGKEKEVDFEARRKQISARLTQLGGSSL